MARAIADWQLEHFSRLYGDGKLSLSRAAHEAGVSIWEIVDYARSKKIAAQYDIEDFERDWKAVLTRLADR